MELVLFENATISMPRMRAPANRLFRLFRLFRLPATPDPESSFCGIVAAAS